MYKTLHILYIEYLLKDLLKDLLTDLLTIIDY